MRDGLLSEVAERRNPRTSATVDQLIAEHSVGISTARRAIALLKEWGLIVDDRQEGLRIAAVADPSPVQPSRTAADASSAGSV